MYIFFILFFISLTGIIIMIYKKILLLRNNTNVYTYSNDLLILELPDIEEAKKIIKSKIKIYGFKGLVASIRLYVVSLDFFQKKLLHVKNKLFIFLEKHLPKNESQIKKETSIFLKKILDYKNKIREIKSEIERQEGIE